MLTIERFGRFLGGGGNRGRCRRQVLTWLACFAACRGDANAATKYTAAPDATFVIQAVDPPVFMPSSVTVDAAGNVYLSDGVNDRVVVFDSSGKSTASITQVGPERLSGPMGLKIDGEGRLWIADAGHHRIVVRKPDGSLDRTVERDPSLQDRPDITDVVVAEDGGLAWLVDNDKHRIHRVNLASGAWTTNGTRGEGPDQFQYPFAIVLARGGRLFVTDATNGRVQVLSDDGRVVQSLGRIGLEPGELFRPKGLAIDGQGRVWVSDGLTGMIQIFSHDGALAGVLRDDRGEPLRLANPTGLAFDSGGSLYVVEMAASTVRRFTVREEDSAEPAPLADAAAAQQPNECLACHVDWLPEFDRSGLAGRLRLPGENPPPVASRPEVCLSCHDGSVADGRSTVWRDHGHRDGSKLPAGMAAPQKLPLLDGAIACRTCHSAHDRPTTTHVFRDAIYLRVESAPAELCVTCHAQQADTSRPGMHPMKVLDFPLPGELVSHGSEGGNEMTCLTCHRPHGAGADALMALPKEPNAACISCHQQIDGAHFGEGNEYAHPIEKILKKEQKAAMASLGRPTSASRKVVCVSCHGMHDAPEKPLLVAQTQSGDLCIRCHGEQAPVIRSPHNFTRHGDLENAAGVAASQAGACGFCHSVHRAVGEHMWAATEPAPEDASAACMSCHGSGLAGLPNPPPVVHGTSRSESGELQDEAGVGCADCHDVHGKGGATAFVTAEEGQSPRALCLGCHEEAAAIDQSLHQPALLKNYPQSDAFCGPCHKAHAPRDQRPAATAFNPMWHAPLGGDGDSADRACTGCHHAGSWRAGVQFREHPPLAMPVIPGKDENARLPLVGSEDSLTKSVGCATCHVVHGHEVAGADDLGGGANLMLRARRPMVRPFDAPNLCTACHGADALPRFLYYHSTEPRWSEGSP